MVDEGVTTCLFPAGRPLRARQRRESCALGQRASFLGEDTLSRMEGFDLLIGQSCWGIPHRLLCLHITVWKYGSFREFKSGFPSQTVDPRQDEFTFRLL